MVLRVGVLGTANIARKNARALFKSRECELVAVASRDPAKAAAWAADMAGYGAGGKVRTCSYEALLADAEVDAVYVPLPTALHAEWVPKCAAAGKHVLLEKPVAIDAAKFDGIVKACEDADVALMDGTMFMHHPRFHALTRLLDPADRALMGEPMRITTAFTFRGDEAFEQTNIRCSKSGDPLGCVGDLGWYSVRLGLSVFGWALPHSVRAVHHDTVNGVVNNASAEVYWDAGKTRVMSMHCSFKHCFQQWFQIETSADKLIKCDNFVLPESENGCKLEVTTSRGMLDLASRTDTVKEEPCFGYACQEAEMWDAFAAACRYEGGAAARKEWAAMARKTQAVVDAIVHSCEQGREVMLA